MIKKLKLKFIVHGAISVLVLLVIIIGAMNISCYNQITENTDHLLKKLPIDEKGPPDGRQPKYMLDQNYFVVYFDKSGNIISVNSQKISIIDDEEAQEYGKKVFESKDKRGFIHIFRYEMRETDDGVSIIFLNCVKEIMSFREFLLSSILMGVAGYIIMVIIMIIVAEIFTRPIAKNYKKQAQFITDASHALKTPLTVISANLDLIEPEMKDNECFEDISSQVELLTRLTHELLSLARIEESKDKIRKLEFPLSDLVLETSNTFTGPAHSKGIQIKNNIDPLVSFRGDSELIKQLVFILMDNAIKHSAESSDINVTLHKKNKQVILSVCNISKSKITEDDISMIFERFFRASESHGYGIGLSKAKSIVNIHNGKISADSKDDNTFIITVTLPV